MGSVPKEDPEKAKYTAFSQAFLTGPDNSFMHLLKKNVGETHLPSESFVLDRMRTTYFPFK